MLALSASECAGGGAGPGASVFMGNLGRIPDGPFSSGYNLIIANDSAKTGVWYDLDKAG